MQTSRQQLFQRFEREMSISGQSVGARSVLFSGYIDPSIDKLWRLYEAGAVAGLDLTKFHPSASHISPDFRDVFNNTIDDTIASIKER